MAVHELKCWPEFFAAIQNWDKMFEIRHNDRSFEVGDILLLREWIPATKEYTGSSIKRRISYITDFPSGLRDGYVCMGLRPGDATRAKLQKVEEVARELVAAMAGLIVMFDRGPCPRKLEDAITWSENDALARGNANNAIQRATALLGDPPAQGKHDFSLFCGACRTTATPAAFDAAGGQCPVCGNGTMQGITHE